MTSSVVLQRSLNTLTSKQIHEIPLIISLEGKLPPHLIDTTVPLQFCLSLPEPYNMFLQPIISDKSPHLVWVEKDLPTFHSTSSKSAISTSLA
ncbi:hypothetical protein E1B28_000147 [Marasmius oreades]|uniref:Uncharacterized protein n=1 Tax=Marasmius oreades TaxID=181124 RepID=A0A9P7V0T0_9AGAR|nr:uncharacterized protein E1B28_000147 [Marasmius oreades]KAG7098179.1 hypothetical protein E1B28_000147 [Marasmius oreades]